MGGRSANAAAIVVAVLGLVGYALFEGLVSGLALFVAGILLVAIGIWTLQDGA
jgi:putative Mn2+ efflux pump MntP